MILRADFGWIVFVAFLLWLFGVLKSGTRGGGRGQRPAPRPPGGPPGRTQREGSELEELLRQLEGRLGTRLGTRPGAQPASGSRPALTPPVAKPAPARLAPSRSRLAPRQIPPDENVVSLEAEVDREAEVEAIERQRLAAAGARNKALSDADHAAFEARILSDPTGSRPSRGGAGPARPAPWRGFSGATLRDALVWQEILGRPKGLE